VKEYKFERKQQHNNGFFSFKLPARTYIVFMTDLLDIMLDDVGL